MTNVLDSVQCSATSSRTGQRCKRRVIGATVCLAHGGSAPQVKRKRLERIALAEAAAMSPRRHPGEVLLDALHVADTRARQLAQEVDDPRAGERLVEQLERAARLAESALRLDAEHRGQDVVEREGERIFELLQAIFDDQQRDLVSLLTVHAPGALDAFEARWPSIAEGAARTHLGAMHEQAVRELEEGGRRG